MNTPSADIPLQPGDIIGGRYRVIQAVGEGPLDRLYEAQDVHLHERVIVRVMRPVPAGDANRVRMFEEQVHSLRVAENDRSIRLLELSRDDDLGHFAAICNRENRSIPEVLALMSGVDGFEAPPAPPPIPVDGFRFPSSKSQVELESLDPPGAPPAKELEQPRYARPNRPKRLDTLELDSPHISRSTGPRPAMSFKRHVDWGQLLRRLGTAVLALALVGAGVWGYLNWRSGSGTTARDSSDTGPTVMAPQREVQILFEVSPKRARMRINGKLAPGHSILVPESDTAFEVRFEAPGHASRSVKVVPNRNRTVLVVLSRKP